MTVSSTTVKNSYSGDGSNDTFVYGFKIFASSDLQVIIRSSTGVETTKTLTTDYTITGVGSATGGNVVFESSDIPTATETVVLIRNVPQTQAIDYIANDPFPAETHEEGLDRATMTTQQMQEELDRSFKVSRTNTIASSEFTDSATTRASKTLGFDSDGNLTTVADFLPAGGDSAMFQYSTTTADADPGAGKFRLNNATIASATIMYIDDLEFNGTDVSAWVQSWDDVVGNDTNRGRIRISKANTLDTWMVFKVTGAITDATGYSKISLVYIDSAGTFANDDKVFISFVASGEDGAIPGYFYKFDTGTSDADPGAGEIAFNNGTYASATVIFIDDADANGVTVVTDILTWDDSTSTIRGYLMIYDINDRSTYARFKITGASTDASGYVKLAVAHLASNNTFSAADELSVTFVRNGDTGDAATIEVGTVTGNTVSAGGSATAAVANAGSSSAATFNFTFGLPTGATGATGASGTNSQLAMTFSNSTSDADPGAGKIAFNNGTLSSVSVLFVDDADDAGADITSFVQSWDDVTNAEARGMIAVVKEGTPATYALFKVTGAVTDATGYSKVAVTHVVSNGTFSNTDGVGVHFSYSGADGAGDITGVTAGTNLSGGGTSGTVTINLADASTSAKGAASFSSDDFAASSGAITIKADAITLAQMATGTDGNVISYDASGNPVAVATGSAGQILTSAGAGAVPSFQTPSASLAWQSSIVTASTVTVESNKGYWINTTSNTCTITLPGSASVGDEIKFSDYARTWGTNKIIIDSNGLKYQGEADTFTVEYTTNGQNLNIIYSGSTKGWLPFLDKEVADAPSPPVTQKGIFVYGMAGGSFYGSNLVNSSGVVATDVTAVGSTRQSASGATYGTDKGIVYGGQNSSGTLIGVSNLITNNGVVGTDVTAVGARQKQGGAGYGLDKAIFAFGVIGSGQTNNKNLVSNVGVVATDTSGAGTVRILPSAVGYGSSGQAVIAFGEGSSGNTAVSNLISNTGAIASDTTGVGTVRHHGWGTMYGGDKGVMAYGNPDSAANTNVSNKISNLGVVASDTSGVGTGRKGICAVNYGGDKGVFAFGDTGSFVNTRNLVNNVGVIASDASGVGTARFNLASAGYSLSA